MEPYESPGVLFGGVDAGPAFPLNALNRFTDVGGFIMPFVGYKFFQDRDLQLNPGIVGGVQFLASDAAQLRNCVAPAACGRTREPRVPRAETHTNDSSAAWVPVAAWPPARSGSQTSASARWTMF
jgi:hypothetical protein